MTQTQTNSDSLFVEVFATKQTPVLPHRIDVLISSVEPRYCNPLMKELSYLLPLTKTRQSNNQNIKNHDNDSRKTFDNEPVVSDLGHLKRIRNQKKQKQKQKQKQKMEHDNVEMNANNGDPHSLTYSPSLKKARYQQNHSDELKATTLSPAPQQTRLDIILGTPENVYAQCSESVLQQLKHKYKLTMPFQTISVPGRSANSKEELKEWNAIWPTVYFHRKTSEHLMETMALTKNEIEIMELGMKEAIQDATVYREQIHEKNHLLPHYNIQDKACNHPGVVIMCPVTKRIISRGSEEWKHQYESQGSTSPKNYNWWNNNPLSTSIMLAIQGVSRKERNVAIGNGMDSHEFKQGQYLCTGYDAYMTKEPKIFEAMALVHSRIRRVIYGAPDSLQGGLGGTGEQNAVHCLPGTNHHYRVFKLCPKTNKEQEKYYLWGTCHNLHSNLD